MKKTSGINRILALFIAIVMMVSLMPLEIVAETVGSDTLGISESETLREEENGSDLTTDLTDEPDPDGVINPDGTAAPGDGLNSDDESDLAGDSNSADETSSDGTAALGDNSNSDDESDSSEESIPDAENENPASESTDPEADASLNNSEEQTADNDNQAVNSGERTVSESSDTDTVSDGNSVLETENETEYYWVTVIVDGEEWSDCYPAGTSLRSVLPESPEKKDFVFVGWIFAPDTVKLDSDVSDVKEGIVATAQFIPAEQEPADESDELTEVPSSNENGGEETPAEENSVEKTPEDVPADDGKKSDGDTKVEMTKGAKGSDEPEDGAKNGDESTREVETEETWTVTFYDRNANVYSTVYVVKNEAIGDQLPEVPYREDYTGAWYLGSYDEFGTATYGNGPISSTYVPEADTTIIPKYEKIVYTITFYKEDKTTLVATRTVDVDTSYCLNDIPTVPAKAGNSGRWVYSGGDFGHTTRVSSDMDVWAAYTQNVFTVTFKVDGSTYATDTYYYGDTLTLPEAPVVEGKEFVKWFADADGDGAYDEGETVYAGGEQVTSDLTLIADLKDEFYVRFIVLADDGVTEIDRLAQYFRTAGEAIGTMPQDPFVAGRIFVKWVIQGTDTEVTADMVVEDSMTVVAVFRTIDIYRITVDYYYLNDRGTEVVFNTDLLEVEAHELDPAYVITAPSTTQTDPNEVAGAPIYYPSTPTVSVTEADFNPDKECTVRIKYVPFTATYDFVYLLKDLTGNGYTEIERQADVHGVLNSYVTPTVRTYDHYTLEIAQGAIVTQDGTSGVVGTGATDKQEFVVKYTRNDYTLSYETNGGTYVQGGTYKYGASATVSTTTPTRAGYTFAGWYLDEGLTQSAGNTVTINGNTTLYSCNFLIFEK